jgi:hypothetical protein
MYKTEKLLIVLRKDCMIKIVQKNNDTKKPALSMLAKINMLSFFILKQSVLFE